MTEFGKSAVDMLTAAGGKILLALVVFIVGKFIIGRLLKIAGGSKALKKTDPTVRKFALDFFRVLLYVILVVSIIGILGIPMSSIIAVLASAGVAIGLALQGALGNLAGGIMLMIFRPFSVGDYVSGAGAEGVVKEITLFYTVITTVDNKTITVPNGSLMNANITNFSREEKRRVDLTFGCAKGEDAAALQDIMVKVMEADPRVDKDPAPFARLSGGTNEAMEFTVRAWCDTDKYWDVYFDLTQNITKALGDAGVKAPAVRIVSE